MCKCRNQFSVIEVEKKQARGRGGIQKHSEVRPQGGHVYNYKALQRVGG